MIHRTRLDLRSISNSKPWSLVVSALAPDGCQKQARPRHNWRCRPPLLFLAIVDSTLVTSSDAGPGIGKNDDTRGQVIAGIVVFWRASTRSAGFRLTDHTFNKLGEFHAKGEQVQGADIGSPVR